MNDEKLPALIYKIIFSYCSLPELEVFEEFEPRLVRDYLFPTGGLVSCYRKFIHQNAILEDLLVHHYRREFATQNHILHCGDYKILVRCQCQSYHYHNFKQKSNSLGDLIVCPFCDADVISCRFCLPKELKESQTYSCSGCRQKIMLIRETKTKFFYQMKSLPFTGGRATYQAEGYIEYKN